MPVSRRRPGPKAPQRCWPPGVAEDGVGAALCPDAMKAAKVSFASLPHFVMLNLFQHP